MLRLSIIVPFLGDLKRFEDTLVSVLENRPERSQVLVVLNQAYEDPYELDGEVEFVDAPSGATLANCLDWGLAATKAPLVHIAAAGVEATPDWTEAAIDQFSDPEVAAVIPVVVERDNPERILTAGLHYTPAGAVRRIAGGRQLKRFLPDDALLCGPEISAAFYRKEALLSVEALQNHGSDLVAGADLALALRSAGYRCVQEPCSIMTSDRELLAGGGSWREGVANERLFRRWNAVPGWKRSWTRHVGLVAAECAQLPLRPATIGRLAGRAWASLGFGPRRTARVGIQSPQQQKETVLRPHFNTEGRGPLPTRAAG